MRAIVLVGCFAAGSGAGAWLGYALALVSGLASAGPPPFFPGGDPAAAALALGALAVLCVFAQRAGASSSAVRQALGGVPGPRLVLPPSL